MKHDTKDRGRLFDLLEEWRPEPEPSPEFMLRLRQRIAAAEAERPRGLRAFGRGWWLALRHDALNWRPQPWGGLVALALVMVVTGLWWRGATPRPAAPIETAALSSSAGPVVRDLQVMDHYGDLLNNLDFLAQSGSN